MKWLFTLLATLNLAAQDPSFGVQSRFVLVPVMVTDAQGKPVDGLEEADFALLDKGKRQKVTVDTIGTGVAPIALIVAVQAAGISGPVLDKVRKVSSMVQPLLTGARGCAGLVAFSERVNWLTECTQDPNALDRAFAALQPGAAKSAHMLDAAQQAVERLKVRKARRVLLLISESRDRGSETDLQTLLLAAQNAGVTIYAMTYSAFQTAFTQKSAANAPRKRGPATPNVIPGDPNFVPLEGRMDILGGFAELARLGQVNMTEVLTKQTGGVTLPFARQKGLENAIEKLGGELHTQYVLGFTPDTDDPGYHPLEVRVNGRPGLQIRARPGYWTVPATP
ncbi:MAG: VWA domain-containing protein [Bryobacteraceae bacterium]|nr:VWA domain-containing protein [Bryobacteraceae bacterium]